MRATRLLLAAVAVAATVGCTRAPGITGPDPKGAVDAAMPGVLSYGLGAVGSGDKGSPLASSADSTVTTTSDFTATPPTGTSQSGLGGFGSGG